jgi:hypothetical protein
MVAQVKKISQLGITMVNDHKEYIYEQRRKSKSHSNRKYPEKDRKINARAD